MHLYVFDKKVNTIEQHYFCKFRWRFIQSFSFKYTLSADSHSSLTSIRMALTNRNRVASFLIHSRSKCVTQRPCTFHCPSCSFMPHIWHRHNKESETFYQKIRSCAQKQRCARQPVTLTYDGDDWAPTNPGRYAICGRVDSVNWTTTNTTELTVDKGTQRITFPQIGNQRLTNTVTLHATVTSGLPLTYFVESGPAQLNDTTLTFRDYGWVTVRCSQTNDICWYATAATNRFKVQLVSGSMSSLQLLLFE